MKAIYVAGPYTAGGEARNVRAAIDAGNRLAEFGMAPFIPHLSHFWEIVHPHPYEFWMARCLEWVGRCDALLLIPGASPGAVREVEHARALGLPVFTTTRQAQRWAMKEER